IIVLCWHRKMPERGRRDQSGDGKSGDKRYKHNRDYSGYDAEERGTAGDRRAGENRQRDMTTASHRHEGTSRRQNPQFENIFFLKSHKSLSPGICQLAEVFVNLLIIICAGVPYSNNGGYRDLASLGGLYTYYYGGASAFTGADAKRVQELDRLFHELKRPPYIFTMAAGGILMIYAFAMLGLGIFRVPFRCPPVLLVEAVLSFLIGLGYIPGIAIYFIKLKETYDNPICKEREQMYKSKGHQGFDCKYNGADIAEGLFGVLGVVVFIFGAVLAIRAFRSVRELKKQRTNQDDNF
uniref:MARVEL domain-containing protein n=1 Tax=Astatotilapia calliptera TaxID=8154 RepID=A0A3P8NEP4_ASTCA